MKISISSPASVHLASNDVEVRSSALFAEICRAPYDAAGHVLSEYLDEPLLDAGIIGREIGFVAIGAELRVEASYWSPSRLDDANLRALVDFTMGQWSDGAGESGFAIDASAGAIRVIVSDVAEDAIVEQWDDGRQVPAPSMIARYAAQGMLDELRMRLSSGEPVDGTRGGYTGLHLAILAGHVDVCLVLIDSGADVNRLDPEGETPLHLLAVANALSDDQSVALAAHLLGRGAKADVVNGDGETASQLARMRKKVLLQRLLESHRAS